MDVSAIFYCVAKEPQSVEPLEERPLVQPLLRARVAKWGEERAPVWILSGGKWWLFPRAASESFRASYVWDIQKCTWYPKLSSNMHATGKKSNQEITMPFDLCDSARSRRLYERALIFVKSIQHCIYQLMQEMRLADVIIGLLVRKHTSYACICVNSLQLYRLPILISVSDVSGQAQRINALSGKITAYSY